MGVSHCYHRDSSKPQESGGGVSGPWPWVPPQYLLQPLVGSNVVTWMHPLNSGLRVVEQTPAPSPPSLPPSLRLGSLFVPWFPVCAEEGNTNVQDPTSRDQRAGVLPGALSLLKTVLVLPPLSCLSLSLHLCLFSTPSLSSASVSVCLRVSVPFSVSPCLSLFLCLSLRLPVSLSLCLIHLVTELTGSKVIIKSPSSHKRRFYPNGALKLPQVTAFTPQTKGLNALCCPRCRLHGEAAGTPHLPGSRLPRGLSIWAFPPGWADPPSGAPSWNCPKPVSIQQGLLC